MTQAKALRALIGRQKFQSDPSMATPAKLLGLLAIANAVAFFIVGIITPLYLTGNLGTAIVRSKFADNCVGYEDRDPSKRYTAQLADSFFKRCLLNTFDVAPACSEESGVVGNIPQLLVDRETSCPFPGDVCVDGIQPVRVEHQGLSARDFGVNLDRRVLVDHRLTCAPLKTEQFMLPYGPGQNWIWFGRNFHDPSYKSNVSATWGTFLTTPNGPNKYSNAFSGNPGAITGQPQAVYELNIYPFSVVQAGVASGEDFHPSVRRDDGHVFFTMLRAGRSLYRAPIDDPFYAAHNNSAGFYIPDYEATALGCVEQFRMCFNDGKKSFCTNMGQSINITLELVVWGVAEKVLGTGLDSLGLDINFIYNAFFTGLGSLTQYFYIRTGTQVLLTSVFKQGDIVDFVDQKEQWVEEVKSLVSNCFLKRPFLFAPGCEAKWTSTGSKRDSFDGSTVPPHFVPEQRLHERRFHWPHGCSLDTATHQRSQFRQTDQRYLYQLRQTMPRMVEEILDMVLEYLLPRPVLPLAPCR
jgi:hypothetical protein